MTRNLEAGIDVEAARDSSDLVALAERFFAPCEAAALRALPTTEQRDRFYSTWTLKEAYAKARGLGFAFPFHRIAFRIADGVIAASFEPETVDHKSDWSFLLWRPTARHWCAVATRSATGSQLRINPQCSVRWLV